MEPVGGASVLLLCEESVVVLRLERPVLLVGGLGDRALLYPREECERVLVLPLPPTVNELFRPPLRLTSCCPLVVAAGVDVEGPSKMPASSEEGM